MWLVMYTYRMATKSMNATKSINHNRNVPFITTCTACMYGSATFQILIVHGKSASACFQPHIHTTDMKLKCLFTSDAAYLEVWDHVLCNANKVLGKKPAKQRFNLLYRMVHAGNSGEHCRHIRITNHHTSTVHDPRKFLHVSSDFRDNSWPCYSMYCVIIIHSYIYNLIRFSSS